MKKSLYKYLGLLLVMMLSMDLLADRYDVEKKKVIEKSYDVQDHVRLKVKNSFGKIHVNTWGNKTIAVRVEVIVRRRSEERAMELLDKIEIDIDESSSEISFVTNFKGKMTNSNNENFEINYYIDMPGINPLELANSFGEIYVADRNGENDIKISYGELRLEKLSGHSDIKISFSDGYMKAMNRGVLEIKYSDIDIEELGVVRLKQGFSDLDIEKAETMDLVSKYGSLKIGSVVGIKGSVGFSGFSIDYLEKEANLETSYSGFTIRRISKDFTSINVEGKFGEMNFQFEEGVNAMFNVTTKLCDLNYSQLDINMNYQVKGDFNSDFRGELGNGKGGVINVTSGYGDVSFR